MLNSDNNIDKIIKIMNREGLSEQKKVYSGLKQFVILSQLYHGEIPSEEITNYRLSIGGNTYIGNNDNSYTFEINEKDATSEDIRYADTTVYFGIKILSGSKPLIATKNEQIEFHNKYPKDKIVLYGKEMNRNNDVMISDYILEKFGVSNDEYPNLIGEKITVSYYKSGEETVLIDGSSLCGILSQNFFRVEKERASAQFFIDIDNPSLNSIKDFDLTIQSDIPGFETVEYYTKRLANLNIGDIYYDEKIVEIYGDMEKEKEILSFMFTLIIIVISIASILNVYYMQYYQMQQKKYFFGLISAIGMTRRSIRKLLFSELCFIAFSSAILSIVISIILIYVVSTYTENILSSNLYSDPSQFILYTIIVLLIAPIISYAIVYYNEHQLYKERLISLLDKSAMD
jgi:ABC-type antimicrobial peptide transport system permease subunit